jgi:hypothetical protein
MAITLRSQKGSALTFNEMDENFITLSGNTVYAEEFKTLVADAFDLESTSGMTIFNGAEELEGIYQVDGQLFFDAIDLEDFEAFKAPILREEGNYIVYYGTKFTIIEEGSVTIMVDGIIVAQGGDLAGPGKFTKVVDDISFAEEIEGSNLSQKYVYFFNEGVHTQTLTQDLMAFGGGLVNIVVTVPDDADAWEDVTITVKELTTA